MLLGTVEGLEALVPPLGQPLRAGDIGNDGQENDGCIGEVIELRKYEADKNYLHHRRDDVEKHIFQNVTHPAHAA